MAIPDDPSGTNDAPEFNSEKKAFSPEILRKAPIAIPLIERMKAVREKARTNGTKEEPIPVIIDLNLRYTGGDPDSGNKREEAAKRVRELIGIVVAGNSLLAGSLINEQTTKFTQQYIFARLQPTVIEGIAKEDSDFGSSDASKCAIFRIWPDFEVNAFTTKSISTVKVDAAHASFSAFGKDITWAVLDSGVDRTHRHFKAYGNIHEDPTYHRDFTGSTDNPFQDDFGHGTHVAGIICGGVSMETEGVSVVITELDEQRNVKYTEQKIKKISGMAPQCKIASMKILDEKGSGVTSSIIAAIAAIQDINGYGRDVRIHGVNMSLGYDFQPEWFACGQSPLCVEVNRLVKSGVVVVVAAGNTGYAISRTVARGDVAFGLPLSINDPGNAELAITVGSTHRDMPHTYGVSYFSSKGPTGDGRLKPDLVAPGEKIISCAAGAKRKAIRARFECEYLEDSGTSMAAPHVSGVIAGFLSVRREFIGRPEEVKELFLKTATDLKRDRYFQGAGLVDLMRAIQAV